MKNLAHIIVLSLIAFNIAKAQQRKSPEYLIEYYLESTMVNSPMLGVSIGRSIKKIHEVGFFYQNSAPYFDHTQDVNRGVGKEFYGMYYTGQVKKWKKSSFNGHIRAVLGPNGYSFSLGYEFQVEPVKNIHVGTGVFIRGMLPSALLSLQFKLGR